MKRMTTTITNPIPITARPAAWMLYCIAAAMLLACLFVGAKAQAQTAPLPNVPSVCAKVWRQKLTDAIAENLRQIHARLTAIETTNAKLAARLDALEQLGPPPPPPTTQPAPTPPPVQISRTVMPMALHAVGQPGDMVWITQPLIDPNDDGIIDVAVFDQALRSILPAGFSGYIMLDLEGNAGWVDDGMERHDAQLGIALDMVHAAFPGAKAGIYAWPVTRCNATDDAMHASAMAMPLTRAKVDFLAPSIYDDSLDTTQAIADADHACVRKAVAFALSMAGGKPVIPVVTDRVFNSDVSNLTLEPDAQLKAHVAEAFVPNVMQGGVVDFADRLSFWKSDKDYDIAAEIPAGVTKTDYITWCVARSYCLIKQAALGDTCVPPTKPAPVIVAPPPPPPPPPPPTSGNTVTWTGANSAARSMTIAPPAPNGSTLLAVAGNGLDLSNRSDITAGPGNVGALPAPKDVIHCGNLPLSNRVVVTGVTGSSVNYGAFISGYASDWKVTGCTISQRASSQEHGMRAAANRLLVENTTVNTELAGKRTLWYFGPKAAFVGCTLTGGAVWFGALDTDMSGTIIGGVNVLVRASDIIQTRPDMPEAICVRSGVQELVLEDVDIVYQSKPLAVDSRRTGDVILRRVRIRQASSTVWKNITMNDIGGDRSKVVLEN